jgi:diguanylate cyclase (GGDEF)-like protein
MHLASKGRQEHVHLAALTRAPRFGWRRFQDIAAELKPVISAASHSPIAERERAQLIFSRCRFIAVMLAVLTPGWIVVDTLALPARLWAPLAAARVIMALIFLQLSIATAKSHNIRTADKIMFAFFSVATVFCVFANLLLAHGRMSEDFTDVAMVYSHLPFIAAACIGLFPMTALQSGAISLQLLIGAAVIDIAGAEHVDFMFSIFTILQLAFIAAIGSLSAICQLRFHLSSVENATRDTLTGLATRNAGTELLEAQMQFASRKGVPFSMVFIDLDYFKRVNDSFGHDMGDLVLAKAARQLRAAFRRQDILIRWGGEEFLVVCPETSAGQIAVALERLSELGLGQRPDGSAQTASIGVVEWRPERDSPDLDLLVEMADRRMYEAKNAGRNRIAMPNGELRDFLPLDGRDPAEVSEALVHA